MKTAPVGDAWVDVQIAYPTGGQSYEIAQFNLRIGSTVSHTLLDGRGAMTITVRQVMVKASILPAEGDA
jgi:hypothetical protein